MLPQRYHRVLQIAITSIVLGCPPLVRAAEKQVSQCASVHDPWSSELSAKGDGSPSKACNPPTPDAPSID
jgi:hypothetical protein